MNGEVVHVSPVGTEEFSSTVQSVESARTGATGSRVGGVETWLLAVGLPLALVAAVARTLLLLSAAS